MANKQRRAELRDYFKPNAIPTAGNFADLIESALNLKDDGLTKAAGEPLSVEASSAGNMAAIKLYESSAVGAAWTLSLRGTPQPGAASKAGLTLSDTEGRDRLFIDSATGAIAADGAISAGGGLTVPAGQTLAVAGTLNATGAIQANAGLSIPAGQTLTVAGTLNATGTVSTGAQTASGLITASGGLAVPAGQTLTVAGTLNATGTVSTGAQTASGLITASGGLTVPSGRTLTVAGTLNATGTVSTGAQTASGLITASGGLTVPTGQTLTVAGTLNATGAVTTGSLTASGLITANGGLTVPASQTLTVAGTLSASGPVTTASITAAAVSTETLTASSALIRRLMTNNAGGNQVFLELAQSDANPASVPATYPSIRFHHAWRFWYRIEARPDGFHLKVGDTAQDHYCKLSTGDVNIHNGLVTINRRAHRNATANNQPINKDYAVMHVKGVFLGNHVRAHTLNGTTIVAGSKNFEIDHPLDPRRKILVHSSLEGPEVGVYYRGEGQLVDGRAEIVLPAYFEALTRKEDRTVSITPRCEGDEPASALAATGITGGRCAVRAIDDRNPSQRFYWEVKAVRADLPPLTVERRKRGGRAAVERVEDLDSTGELS